MKAAHISPVRASSSGLVSSGLAFALALGLAACAHAPERYAFTSSQTPNDLDVVVRTLKSNGLKPAQIDRKLGTVTTYWFDTGYHFRETDLLDPIQYPTNIFLRYRVTVRPDSGKATVVLDTDVQRCAPLDVTVTASGVSGSCEPMTVLFSAQQKQTEALGEKLKQALRGAVDTSLASS
jgi:hypothetical protein